MLEASPVVFNRLKRPTSVSHGEGARSVKEGMSPHDWQTTAAKQAIAGGRLAYS